MVKNSDIGSIKRATGPDPGTGSAKKLAAETLKPPLIRQDRKLAMGMLDPVGPGGSTNVTDNYQATNKVRKKPPGASRP